MASSPLGNGQVTIIGAGVIGTACALFLLRDGWRVRLIDRGAPGGGTSSGNAGSISSGSVVPIALPGMARQIPSWLLDPLGPLSVRWSYAPKALPWLTRWLFAATRPRGRAAAISLATLTFGAVEEWQAVLKPFDRQRYIRRDGQLLVSRNPRLGPADEFALSLREANGVEVNRVGADDIRQLEPALSHEFQCGLFVPDSGHTTDPHALVRALYGYFVSEGGEFLNTEVIGLTKGEGGEVHRIETADGWLEVDRLVIAAGAYSARLSSRLGDRIPLETERGYHATLADPGIEIARPTSDIDRKFFATSMEAGLRFAGTVEIAGLDAPPNYERARALVTQGRAMFPALKGGEPSVWMGRRPSIPDSLPVIGPSPRADNVWYAFGHGHLGLTMAPATGRLIAALIACRSPHINPVPFRADRFGWAGVESSSAHPTGM